MRAFMAITKALADPNRVRMLLALDAGELCVCQITALLALAPSTISRHLSILHHAGLIESRKAERWVYYSLPGRAAPVVVREALDWVRQALAEGDVAETDGRRLKAILQEDPSDLCRRQMAK